MAIVAEYQWAKSALQESASRPAFEIVSGTGSSPSVPVRTVMCRNSTALANEVNASVIGRTYRTTTLLELLI
ncbi:hypothetical protein [Mesorhizobium sp.]|uniref:hypothetical protein n=1 Tax=Mesorhizobium sp. TaxID=1871066 RepID=UPI0025F4CCE9|nr:hypothetical protein [Mesorhizobium sp.]